MNHDGRLESYRGGNTMRIYVGAPNRSSPLPAIFVYLATAPDQRRVIGMLMHTSGR